METELSGDVDAGGDEDWPESTAFESRGRCRDDDVERDRESRHWREAEWHKSMVCAASLAEACSCPTS